MSKKYSAFPFPDYSLAMDELKRDYVFKKIPIEKSQELVDLAWNLGTEAAIELKKFFKPPYYFTQIAKDVKLEVIDKDIDRVIGNFRFFSEYITKQSKIFMYIQSIKKWGEVNSLDYETAYNFVLAHEFFHFLEYTKYGLTSRIFQVPILKFGKFTIGKTGIRAMSEIGAHAFVNELFLKGEVNE